LFFTFLVVFVCFSFLKLEQSYKEHMRKRLQYEEWENKVLLKARTLRRNSTSQLPVYPSSDSTTPPGTPPPEKVGSILTQSQPILVHEQK
jgi:hypothetical protein